MGKYYDISEFTIDPFKEYNIQIHPRHHRYIVISYWKRYGWVKDSETKSCIYASNIYDDLLYRGHQEQLLLLECYKGKAKILKRSFHVNLFSYKM